MQPVPDAFPNPRAAAPGVALPDEIAAFVESGLSIILGVVGPDHRAQTGRALAARVLPGGRLRLICAEEGNATVLATARAGGPIAATLSAPLSHRTLQIKGLTCRLEPIEPEDEGATRFQTDAFAAVLGAIGYPPVFVRAFSDYRSSPLFVLGLPVQEMFEQTPGPGAGRAL